MSEWIEWKGGEMPVPGDTVVEYKLPFTGRICRNHAKNVQWGGNIYGLAVEAYRIVQPDVVNHVNPPQTAEHIAAMCQAQNQFAGTPLDAPKTLRDEFAMAAMPLAYKFWMEDYYHPASEDAHNRDPIREDFNQKVRSLVADTCYDMADEMMKARKQ